MKIKSLQFGKAMSAALFVLLLSVAGMKNVLAQNQVATLQHVGAITGTYYGENALTSAYYAASGGDIITLSSGTFRVSNPYTDYFNINNITIRGAGCEWDSLTGVAPTIISGNFYLSQEGGGFEGVNFLGVIGLTGHVIGNGTYGCNNVSFVKCYINEINLRNDAYAPNVHHDNMQFVNCIIKNLVSSRRISNGETYSFYYIKNLSIINSVVRVSQYDHGSASLPTCIHNSIVLFDDVQPIKNIIAYNSIVATVSDHTVTNCTFFNCLGIKTGETSLFEGQTVQNVMEMNSYEDVFETFTGTVFYGNGYQLKEELATTFLGNDGTEVGIYGGMLPYNPRPSYMRIKRCNVAPRSTVDGKLSVDIEVLTDDE
jgi:hypothetical protein